MIKAVYIGVMQSQSGQQNGFTAAMSQVFDEYIEIPMSDSNRGLRGLKPGDIDLVFLQPQDGSIASETLQHLKSQNIFVINWSGDVRSQIPTCYFEYAKYIDLTCFSNMNDVKTMRSLGYDAEFLNIGYDPAIYYPDNSIEKDIPICFMGNNFGHFPLSGLRIEMVRELKCVYGDDFKAYGSDMPDGSYMGNQKGEADIYRRTKIGINLSHFDYERYTSDRMMRLLGSGLLVLSHEYKGIYEDFNPHDMGIWRNFDELKSHIDYYLANEDARMKIANNGYQKAITKFRFVDMAQNILELYNQHKQN